MKKFLISTLALFFVFATVHAQTSDSSASRTTTTMHKTKASGTAMRTKHKTAHHRHHKAGTAMHKTKSTNGTGTAAQKPVANTTASTKTTTMQTTAKAGAKGAHYAVNSNGKKTYVKSPRSK